MKCDGGGCEAPDACGNEEREEKLLASQRKDDDRHFLHRILERDQVLIIAGILMMLLLNIETGKYVLYPFEIFTTWVHEMCHGTAAILMGGRIAYLHVNPDGSGVCGSAVPGPEWRWAFVSSAGYPGATFWGCIMLLFRRTTLGPTIGMMTAGILMLLSVILYVENSWGDIVLSIFGSLLVVGAWFLPAVLLDHLFAFLGLACSMNAIEDIKNLYGFGSDAGTDAHTVANYWGGDHITWATAWLIFGIVMTFIGIVFARDAREVTTRGGGSSGNSYKLHEPYDYSKTFLPSSRVWQAPQATSTTKTQPASSSEGLSLWKKTPQAPSSQPASSSEPPYAVQVV